MTPAAVRLSLKHIGEVTTPFIFEEPVTIDAASIVDVEVNLRVADRMRLGLGANNIMDRLPNRLPDGAVAQLWSMDYPAESPYGIAGRVLYVRMELAGS